MKNTKDTGQLFTPYLLFPMWDNILKHKKGLKGKNVFLKFLAKNQSKCFVALETTINVGFKNRKDVCL